MESKQERHQSAGQTDGLARRIRNCPSLHSELRGPINVASGVGFHAATVTANTTAGETCIT